jgi:sugar lactone lactonase YvrE
MMTMTIQTFSLLIKKQPVFYQIGFLILSLNIPAVFALEIMTPFAGNGTAGYSGDGGSAVQAQLQYPTGLTIDHKGHLYIADTENHCIRKVDTKGNITTIIGTGIAGDSGDQSAATTAQLNQPRGIALNRQGHLYIADYQNHRIRRVDTSGIVITVAGTGTEGYSGDNSSAIKAQLHHPLAVAIDAEDNLYIADSGNYRIRRVTVDGIITTVAGVGSHGYSGDNGAATHAKISTPYHLVLDKKGNLYFADTLNQSVRKIDPRGIIMTIAGDGTAGDRGDNTLATTAQLNHPVSLAIDSLDNLFIAEKNNHRIRRVSPNGLMTTVAGDGQSGSRGDHGAATAAQLNAPEGIALAPNGGLYISDTHNHRIRKVK